VAGVSGGQGGSPIAVPERSPAVAVSGDAPEPRLLKAPSCSPRVAGASDGAAGLVRAGAGRAAVTGLPWSGNPRLPTAPSARPVRTDHGRTAYIRTDAQHKATSMLARAVLV